MSGQPEHWELVFLLVTGPCYVLWRLGCREPEAHLQCSRQICKILSWLACLRWIAIWAFPDPQTAFINVVSGLLYLPLLLGCLMLLGGQSGWHQWIDRQFFAGTTSAGPAGDHS